MAKRFKGEAKTGRPQTLTALFMSTPCGDHMPRGTTGDVEIRKVGPVLVVHRNESLPRVFRKLTVEGFLSAPVVEGTRYIGFIDMMDLVQKTKELFWGDTEEAWTSFWDKEARFVETTIDDILGLPSGFDREAVPPISSEFSTFAALEAMVRNNFHRVAIVQPNTKKLESILTQSMLISWLRQNKPLLGTLRTTLVSDILEQLPNASKLISVNQSEKAINAFNQMAASKVSGLPVVDEEGLLVNSISIRDLRTVGTSGEFFHRLFRDIKQFKQLAREEHLKLAPRTHYSTKQVPRSGLFVTPEDTIENVLDKMYDGNVHRVYVCNDRSLPKPVSVISQVDVLRMVLDHIVKEAQYCDRM
jgi:CBS domain-containing protein